MKKMSFKQEVYGAGQLSPKHFSFLKLMGHLYFQGQCSWNWIISRSAFVPFFTAGLLVPFAPFIWIIFGVNTSSCCAAISPVKQLTTISMEL